MDAAKRRLADATAQWHAVFPQTAAVVLDGGAFLCCFGGAPLGSSVDACVACQPAVACCLCCVAAPGLSSFGQSHGGDAGQQFGFFSGWPIR